MTLSDYGADIQARYIIEYTGGDLLSYTFKDLDPSGDWDINVDARDDNWHDYGDYGYGTITLTAAIENTHNIVLEPPEHDGGYTGPPSPGTLHGSVDIGSYGWSASVDYVTVTLSDGSQTLNYNWWTEWDAPVYEFIWLDPSETWTLSATAYNDSHTIVSTYAGVTATVASGDNTQDIMFSE